MRWIRFTANNRTSYGSLAGDTVTEVSGEPWANPNPTGKTHKLADVTLEVPVIPRTFYAAGINYAAHIREMAAKRGVEPVFPEKADIGYRANNALVAHDQDVVIPTDATEKINYEGELVVVIGKQAKNVSKENARAHVFGYTCACDVTARDLQKKDVQFTRAKGFDTFCPIGPWIETDLDPGHARVRCVVSGQTKQDGSTENMIFDVATLVSYVSHMMTLEPGDVILTGTPEGVGPLAAGDTLEVEVTGVGVLKLRVEK
jgi:2-keto-4-pentenoate hydratase/2-oxohepta-3-ene-1,7-dioic acid hydratase in catechol pathway